jgi:acetyl-CoA synthetase
MPLSMLFGPDALEYRINDSEARLAIVDESGIANVLAARPLCPKLATVLAVGAAEGRGDLDWRRALADAPGRFAAVRTRADEAAVLIYTSGTTGPPKGTLIPHRALIGNLPGFVCSQNWFPQDDAVFWSPADWAWTGGLMDALLPTLYFGREIVALQRRFAPELAFEVMERHRVTHTFLFPTALKAMMKAVPAPRERFTLSLRAIMSAGEAVGDAVFAWCRDALGVVPNEMFGQTEINYIVGNCACAGRRAPAAWGGRTPATASRSSTTTAPSARAERPATSRCTGATSTASATRSSSSATGSATTRRAPSSPATRTTAGAAPATPRPWTADGYLWYQGRSDDVFKAAGYRIGPSEIENCLVKHAAVANAAVVPKPDASAARSSRRSSSWRPASPRRASSSASSRRTCAASSRPTSTRRRSSSSTRCR